VEVSPAVQYTSTPDGVRIAFYKMGSGPPVVVLMPNPSSHLTLEWQVPALRDFYNNILRRASLIRLDYRGSGLSERRIASLTADEVQTDILAVWDRLGLEHASALGWGFGCFHALGFAARHPDRAIRLAFLEAWAPAPQPSLNRTIAGLRSVNSKVQIKTRANLNAGWIDAQNATGMEDLISGAIDDDTIPHWRSLIGAADVSEAASRVRAPTLLVHADQDALFPLSGAQALAALLPRSEMRIVTGTASLAPFTDAATTRAVLDFLLEGQEEPGRSTALPHVEDLSSRELEVLRLIAGGKTNDEIARSLVISPSTVSHHVSNILAKTGASNRAEAASLALRSRLL
jgi:DNA-binding NarL/FixJ family response regulator